MSDLPATRHSMVAAIRSAQPDERRSAFDTIIDGFAAYRVSKLAVSR